MNVTKQKQSIQYNDRATARAQRALCCTSFQLDLFIAMGNQSVPLPTIAGQTGMENGYSKVPVTESEAEAQLMWLIKVGLLRREVDGQGITDSFRLTPLGRQIVDKFKKQNKALPNPSWLDRLRNWLAHWLQWIS